VDARYVERPRRSRMAGHQLGLSPFIEWTPDAVRLAHGNIRKPRVRFRREAITARGVRDACEVSLGRPIPPSPASFRALRAVWPFLTMRPRCPATRSSVSRIAAPDAHGWAARWIAAVSESIGANQ